LAELESFISTLKKKEKKKEKKEKRKKRRRKKRASLVEDIGRSQWIRAVSNLDRSN